MTFYFLVQKKVKFAVLRPKNLLKIGSSTELKLLNFKDSPVEHYNLADV